MNSRERVIELADEISVSNGNHYEGANIFTYAEDAAALRELNKLLEELTIYLKNNHDDYSWFELEERLTQAGYL